MEYERLVTYPTYYPEGTALKEEVITRDAMNKPAYHEIWWYNKLYNWFRSL
ncbi:MAG: hypothetical protein ACLU5J_03995 [Christensenellales bacterium]